MSKFFKADAALRRVAKEKNVTVHGVLWVFDRLTEASLCNHDLLIVTLQKWQADPTVFLPKSEIEKRLRLLSNS